MTQTFILGILKEEKNPPDFRVPLTPAQCNALLSTFPNLQIIVHPSDIRCFPDDAYLKAGATLSENLKGSDLLIGVKEVPKERLLEGHHYLFFSHTHKFQPYNRSLLQEVMKKKITLTDYECLTYLNGNRILGFGRFAGVVGAYNGFRTWGLKFKSFTLKPANHCSGYGELIAELQKVKLPAIKILLTGSGRVANGAREILEALKLPEVSMESFLSEKMEKPVFFNADVADYHLRKNGALFDLHHFFGHGDQYASDFAKFTKITDLFIAGHFYDQKAPVFFDLKDIKSEEFNIKVIADISCDISQPIPTTLRASSIAHPMYDVSRKTLKETDLFKEDNAVSVMAVDNLPCELPTAASEDFGEHLSKKVLPLLITRNDPDQIIERATIAQGGQLSSYFAYLSDFVKQP